ncbi:MAG: hypothetical protein ACYCSF_06640 [Acidimicrobiales bacterium]
MRTGLRAGTGVVLCVVGVVWIGQGVGAIHGSFMTSQPLWAGAGIVCLIAGLALVARAVAMRRQPGGP